MTDVTNLTTWTAAVAVLLGLLVTAFLVRAYREELEDQTQRDVRDRAPLALAVGFAAAVAVGTAAAVFTLMADRQLGALLSMFAGAAVCFWVAWAMFWDGYMQQDRGAGIAVACATGLALLKVYLLLERLVT